LRGTEKTRIPGGEVPVSIAESPAVPKKSDKPDTEKWHSKPMALQMRGAPAWKAWLEKLAEFERTSVADVADRAIARYAREIGFPDPPPKR
jgi:hypothetical protein